MVARSHLAANPSSRAQRGTYSPRVRSPRSRSLAALGMTALTPRLHSAHSRPLALPPLPISPSAQSPDPARRPPRGNPRRRRGDHEEHCRQRDVRRGIGAPDPVELAPDDQCAGQREQQARAQAQRGEPETFAEGVEKSYLSRTGCAYATSTELRGTGIRFNPGTPGTPHPGRRRWRSPRSPCCRARGCSRSPESRMEWRGPAASAAR